MPTLSNASTSVALPAGQVLTYAGYGSAVLGSGVSISLQGSGTIGPFSRAETVGITGAVTFNAAAVGGRDLTIAQANADSTGAPLASTAGNGTLAVIPILPGQIADHSRLVVLFKCKRTGATATALAEAYLGTTGTTSDSLLASFQLNANSGHGIRIIGEGLFSTLTNSFIAMGSLGINSSGAGATMIEKTTNIDRNQIMYLTIAITAANVADTFTLLGYHLSNEA